MSLESKINVLQYSKVLEKRSQNACCPKWTIGSNEKRFRQERSAGGHLGPGQYRTYRQYVQFPKDDYCPEATVTTALPKYSFPNVGKDGPGGLMSALGGSSSMPDMGPGKYPAEDYMTLCGPKANSLSHSPKLPVYSFSNERKFFAPIGNNVYKQTLGPGSYSLKDGFKVGADAEKVRTRALRDLKKHGQTWAAGEFSKMFMRDARRGEGYTKKFTPSKEQLRAIEAMLGKKPEKGKKKKKEEKEEEK